MKRAFFIFLLALCIGAFVDASIVPQHAIAAPRITSRQVVATVPAKKDDGRFDHQAQSKLIDHLSTKIYAHQLKSLIKKMFQSSLSARWPSISLPDFSFLWKQERSDQRKNLYDRGQ